MEATATVISDPFREAIVVQRKTDGVVLRKSKAWLLLSGAELDRLFAFVRNEPVIQRYPVMAPELPVTGE
jgi:hypothetical protein